MPSSSQLIKPNLISVVDRKSSEKSAAEISRNQANLSLTQRQDLHEKNRVLSFQERKEMFNKTSPTKVKHLSNINMTQNQIKDEPNNSKRPKIELVKETLSLDIKKASDDVKKIDDEAEELGEGSMSANEVFNSAQTKQNSKFKAKSAIKTKTFYGGEEVKDVTKLNLATPLPNTPMRVINGEDPVASIDSLIFEFIGGGVKLEKSNLTVNINQRKVRRKITFTDIADTYEYPSYEFVLREMGIDPDNDPDYQNFSSAEENNSFDEAFLSTFTSDQGLSKSSSDYEDEENEITDETNANQTLEKIQQEIENVKKNSKGISNLTLLFI